MTNKKLLEEAMSIICAYGANTKASDFAKDVIRFLHEQQVNQHPFGNYTTELIPQTIPDMQHKVD
jgi:hypothetical protein